MRRRARRSEKRALLLCVKLRQPCRGRPKRLISSGRTVDSKRMPESLRTLRNYGFRRLPTKRAHFTIAERRSAAPVRADVRDRRRLDEGDERFTSYGRSAAASALDRLGRDRGAGVRRQQSELVHHRRAVRRPRRNSGTRQRRGSAADPGFAAEWAAAPGWTELVPVAQSRRRRDRRRVLRRISAVQPGPLRAGRLVLLVGLDSTSGLTALLSASAIGQWFLPSVPVNAIAIAIICIFLAVNLCGLRTVARLAIPICGVSTVLAFLYHSRSGRDRARELATGRNVYADDPVWRLVRRAHVDDGRPVSRRLRRTGVRSWNVPVGETTTRRAMCRAPCSPALPAGGLYFVVLPVLWLGVLGPGPLGRDLAVELGPTFAPLFGASAKALAIGFMTFDSRRAPYSRSPVRRGRFRSSPKTAFFRAFWLAGLESRRSVDRHARYGRGGDRVLTHRRPALAHRRGEFRLFDRHRIAESGRLAVASRRAAPRASLPCAARHDRTRSGGSVRLDGFGNFRVRAVRIADGAHRYRARLFRSGTLRLAAHGRPAPHRAARHSAFASPHPDDDDGGRALAGRRRIFIAIQTVGAGNTAIVTGLQDIFVIVALLTIGAGLVLPNVIAAAATRELGISNASCGAGPKRCISRSPNANSPKNGCSSRPRTTNYRFSKPRALHGTLRPNG